MDLDGFISYMVAEKCGLSECFMGFMSSLIKALGAKGSNQIFIFVIDNAKIHNIFILKQVIFQRFNYLFLDLHNP